MNEQISPAASNGVVRISSVDALRRAMAATMIGGRTHKVEIVDPAIDGSAMKKGSKTVVRLGRDETAAYHAAKAVQLKEVLDVVTKDFAEVQTELRKYGSAKRDKYNEAYGAKITSVDVPYVVCADDMPEETRYVQVTCANRYSVNDDIVLGKKAEFGECFDRLFVVASKKTLRPNAEQIMRGLLEESGFVGDALDTAMDTLFETKKSVSTTDDFEIESKGLPDAINKILEQSVKRADPSVKFPD